MTTMIKEVYDALIEAGVSEGKASDAARAVEEVRESGRLGRIEQDVGELKGDMKLMRWMIGFNLAASLAILLKLLF